MNNKQEHRVTVDNGKYTFVVPAEGYGVAILHHGELWHEQGETSSALHAMMSELDAARLVVAQVRALAQNWRSGAQARLERVIQQHDALTSDRSPPSAWTGPCDPPGACATHGHCWPHSEWDDPHDPALRDSVDMPDNFRRFNVVDLGPQDQRAGNQMKKIIAGYEIEAHPQGFDAPAHVTIHKLGTAERSWLTPAEARAVAAAIVAGAKSAETE